MKVTTFDSQMSEIYEVATSDFKHPHLTNVKFIFADDKPNGNNMGIEYADFEAIKQSAVDMPIKMRFLGEAGAAGHTGSITIGHIRGMDELETEEGTHQLIAEGVLYADEFPNEVAYLKTSFTEKKAPGASWEISYSEVKKDGPISWLKGVITKAATFVRNPAYGSRTALLALASSNTDMTDEELSAKLVEIATEISPKNPVEGGSNTVDEELKKAKEDLAAALAEIETLRTEKETLSTANAELAAKVTERDEKISTFEKDKLVATRSTLIAEAGLKVEEDPEKLAKAFWTTLSDEAFAEYLETLKAVKPVEKKIGLASLTPTLPRPASGEGNKPLTIEELKNSIRERNRSSVYSE
jgi:hypothetical protein